MIEDEVGDGLSPDPGGYDPYSVQTFPVAARQFDNAGIDFMVDGVPVRYVFADEEFLEVSTSQVPPGLGWLRVPPPAPYNVQRDSLNGWADSLDARADRYETMATSANQARRNAARGGDDERMVKMAFPPWSLFCCSLH